MRPVKDVQDDVEELKLRVKKLEEQHDAQIQLLMRVADKLTVEVDVLNQQYQLLLNKVIK